jgi:iron complex transport system substrate-binding protein
MKIASLLPSATEIVFALGLGDSLVAVTHECDYPPEARERAVVTHSSLPAETRGSREIDRHIAAALHAGSSIYTLDQELLAQLDPELILTQELCDVCAVSYDQVTVAVRRLGGRRRVLSLQPTGLDDILGTVEQVGAAAGVPERARGLVGELRERVETITAQARGAADRPRVLALEWLDPPMTGGHWVPELVQRAGGTDGLGRAGAPSARIDWRRIAAYDPEVIVLMPCGFDLARTVEEVGAVERPAEWPALAAARAGRVYAVDGSAYFNRPGPRIVDGLAILAEILQPERVRPAFAETAWRALDG